MADIDIISLDGGLEGVSMTGSGAQHGSRLLGLVTAVSRRVDALTGPVVAREVVQTIRPNTSAVFLSDWVSWGAFPNQAVQEVTELTEYVSGTGTELTAETLSTSGDFLVVNGMIARRSGFYTTTWNGPFEVTYTAGRFEDTERVDPLFAEAVTEIVGRIWPQYAASWSRGGVDFSAAEDGLGFYRSVDPVIKELLEFEVRPPCVSGA